MKKTALLISLIAITGCTVGPDYLKPDLELPKNWFQSTLKNAPRTSDSEVEHAWWKRFNDPILQSLIDKDLTGNLDIKIAESRIAEARANRSYAANDLLPTVNGKASAVRQSNRIAFPGGGGPFDLTKPLNTFETGFDATWEADLFGGKRRTLEAESATLASEEANADDVRVSMLAEVARTYFEIRQYQQQLALNKDTVASGQTSVKIAQERYKVGETAKLDVMQANAQLQQFQTQIPYYENLLAQSEFNLDILLGEQPGTTHSLVLDAKPLPVADKDLVLSAPAQVIATRPDIRMAEQKLIAATAEKGVAIAALFPDISLSGFAGFLNIDQANLIKGSSRSWSMGGSVLLPIFNYGRLSANIDAADARKQQALDEYRKTLVAALSDVNKAITAYAKQEEFRAALQKTVADNRQVTTIARQRYKEGLSSFLDVLEAQRTLYASESQLASANALVSENLVALYKSLGGGWKDTGPTPVTTPTLTPLVD